MKERYDNLDGLRVISCLCIIAMHIRANSAYEISGWVYNRLIPLWTHFVALFIILSGFGMFCGYYDKFRSGSAELDGFYLKRYKKILPFFFFLILLDIILDRSLSHLIEGIVETSLVFGLLPNNQPTVIGVSWTLGVLFLFYMLFPFFVFLCWNKKRAIFSFLSSVVISLFCAFYYFSEKFVVPSFVHRHSFLYCSPWLLAGCLLFLFRLQIISFIAKRKWPWLTLCCTITVVWYFLPNSVSGIEIWMPKNLLLFLPWIGYSVSVKSRLFSNRAMKYLSSISLEMYLAQMVIFRLLEKLGILYLFGYGWSSFLAIWILLIVGLILFIELWKRCLHLVTGIIKKTVD